MFSRQDTAVEVGRLPGLKQCTQTSLLSMYTVSFSLFPLLRFFLFPFLLPHFLFSSLSFSLLPFLFSLIITLVFFHSPGALFFPPFPTTSHFPVVAILTHSVKSAVHGGIQGTHVMETQLNFPPWGVWSAQVTGRWSACETSADGHFPFTIKSTSYSNPLL